MSEKALRKRVCKMLRHHHAVPVENRVGPGTPDVNCTLGWIELKKMRRWPINAEDSFVLIHHYTAQQRQWHRLRAAAGERTFLLLQVGPQWLLFTGPALQLVGAMTKGRMLRDAHRAWDSAPSAADLVSALGSRA